MHFIDRKIIVNPPIKKLNDFNLKYKDKWIAYKLAIANGTKPVPAKPPSSWLHDDIRNPLESLFLNTCGYCGIHTKIGSDGEVDHHLPIDLDANADNIFNWENYIWACHSCNNGKRNNYPFLNPCLEADMNHIYFHSSDGRYLYYKDSPDIIKTKFEITDKYSNINYTQRNNRRKYTHRHAVDCLNDLKTAFNIYKIEFDIQGDSSNDVQKKLRLFNEKKESFLELLKCGDYIFLIKHAFDSFCNDNSFKFPFSFDELKSEVY